MTTAELKKHTKADLANMAKKLGVQASGTMLKDELVAVVANASKAAGGSKSSRASSGSGAGTGTKARKTGGVNGKAVGRASRSKSSPAKPSAPRASGSKSSESKSRTKRAAKIAGSKATKSKKPAAKATVTKTAKKAAAKPRSSTKAGAKASAKSLVGGAAVSNQATKKKAARKSAASKSQVSQAAGTRKKNVAAKATASAPLATGKKPATKAKPVARPTPKPTSPKILKRIRELQLQRDSGKDISFRPTLVRAPGSTESVWEQEPQKDRIALFVRDGHWMHASWDIRSQAIERAKAAMAEQWHSAKPVLRLLRLDDTGTTSTAETIERDIEIHGGVRNWYIEWSGEATTFRVMIGYLASSGRFHSICESNMVRTPEPGIGDVIDEHWSDMGADSERIFALSGGYNSEKETSDLKELLEQRLHRSMGAPPLAKLGAGSDSPFRRKSDFHFEMEIELVLFGSTVPDGYLTLNGEPITLRSDGTFAMRLPFPDRRQVLPAVACSRDGSQQRTIVVAVERNTKIMEPLDEEKDTGE